jgi:hypothetical protein
VKNKHTPWVGISLLASVLMLAACGGGGSDAGSPPNSAAKAEGAYSGTLTGSASSVFQMLVLENDEYWTLYGSPVGSVFGLAGFIQGSGTSTSGAFSSSNTRDFGANPALSGSVSATYVAGSSISGSVTFGTGAVGFSGTPILPASFDYSQPAALADIAGNWSMTTLAGSAVAVTIAANGSFTATMNGCGITGTFTPRPSGKNVFNMVLTFGGAPCSPAGLAATGIALSYPLAAGKRQLIVAGVDATRTLGTALVGSR